jgi:hypothetical protein
MEGAATFSRELFYGEDGCTHALFEAAELRRPLIFPSLLVNTVVVSSLLPTYPVKFLS